MVNNNSPSEDNSDKPLVIKPRGRRAPFIWQGPLPPRRISFERDVKRINKRLTQYQDKYFRDYEFDFSQEKDWRGLGTLISNFYDHFKGIDKSTWYVSQTEMITFGSAVYEFNNFLEEEHIEGMHECVKVICSIFDNIFDRIDGKASGQTGEDYVGIRATKKMFKKFFKETAVTKLAGRFDYKVFDSIYDASKYVHGSKSWSNYMTSVFKSPKVNGMKNIRTAAILLLASCLYEQNRSCAQAIVSSFKSITNHNELKDREGFKVLEKIRASLEKALLDDSSTPTSVMNSVFKSFNVAGVVGTSFYGNKVYNLIKSVKLPEKWD